VESCRVGTPHRSRDGGRRPPYTILDSRVVQGGWRPSADPGAPASGVGPTTDHTHPTSHSNPRRKSPWFPISSHHSLFVQQLCVAPGGRVLLSTIEVGGVGVPGIVNWGSHGVRFGNPCEGSPSWRRTGSEDGTRGTRGNPSLPTEGTGFPAPPHLWGRVGVGGSSFDRSPSAIEASSPPPLLTLPHKWGGNQKNPSPLSQVGGGSLPYAPS
jgi:hypothetical protein